MPGSSEIIARDVEAAQSNVIQNKAKTDGATLALLDSVKK